MKRQRWLLAGMIVAALMGAVFFAVLGDGAGSPSKEADLAVLSGDSPPGAAYADTSAFGRFLRFRSGALQTLSYGEKGRGRAFPWLAVIAPALLSLMLGFGMGALHHRRQGEPSAEPDEGGERQDLAERYALLSRYANDAIFIIERDGRIVEANERAATSYGYRPGELLGMNIRVIRAQETVVLLDKEMEGIIAGEGMIFETLHRRKDGTVFPVEVSSRAISLGGRRYFQSIIRDLTQRKIAEQNLVNINRMYAFISEINHAIVRVRERDQLFEEICRTAVKYGRFRLAWIGLVDHDRQSVTPFCGTGAVSAWGEIDLAGGEEAAAGGLFGRAVREGCCVVCNDIEHDGGVAPWRDELRRIACRSLTVVPFWHQDRVAGIFNVYAAEPWFFDGREMALLEGIGQDISFALEKLENDIQRRHAEEELRAAEARYRVLFESAPAGVMIIDPETQAPLQFNDMMCRQLGYTREELSRLHVSDWEMADPRTEFSPVDLLPGQGTRETRHRTQAGEVRQVAVTSQLIELGGRSVLFCIYQDITERRRLESQLIQSQKMEAVGNLAGGIAHDFNNVLMGIRGCASLMLLDMDEHNPCFGKLKSIDEYVQSGTALTRHLLEFARGGQSETSVENMNELTEKVALMFGQARKEIAIHTEFADDLRFVRVNRGRMEQVLLNLFVNAWQAMPGGGELYLATRNIDLDEASVKPFALEAGPFVKISVTDTGMGMDEKTKERIFEPFFTTKGAGRGSGLGLTTVYGIVKGHGGVVNVYSEKGVGTVFNILLPVCGEGTLPEDCKAEKKMESKILKGQETVLLVDDEEMIITVTREILELLGYRVLVAGGGEEAINLCRQRGDEIALVILDMMMPAMGGRETFDILREICPDIKVILSSGYNLDGRPAKMLARGCSAFIQKPFSVGELSQKIRDVLDGTPFPSA